MITFDTGKSVFAAINEIANTASKNEKLDLVKTACGTSKLFLKAVTYAYDPFKNYGISNAPGKTHGMAPGTNTLEEPATWKVLDDLISRNLSGGSARTKIQNMVDLLNEPSSEIFRRIINKDMRAGFGESTINKASKGAIPEFPYMRCTLPAKSNMPNWNWLDGIFVQEKADGAFANVNRDNKGGVFITSRSGSAYPDGALGIEDDMIGALEGDTQTHGELLVYENGVLMLRADGNGVLNSLLSGGPLESNQKVVFMAWDQIPKSVVIPKGKYSVTYKERFMGLARQIVLAQRAGITSVRMIATMIVKSKAEAYARYRELLKEGKEGVICKHPSMGWRDTGSSGEKDQVKLKLEFVVELRIKKLLPASPGTKHEATFGSLLCASECGGVEVGVSGMTDAMRFIISNDPRRFLESIVSVKANDIMYPEDGEDKHSLFLPIFMNLREEKSSADSLTEIIEQRQATLEAA